MNEEQRNDATMLRATSDELVHAIREVGAREQLKRAVAPANAAFVELAREVRIAAETVLRLAQAEESGARATSAEPDVGQLPPIESVVPGRELAGILEQWRAIEQRLEAASPGSLEARQLMAEFERMRDEYAAALAAKRERHGRGG